jgi:hypothetical protein
MQKLKLQLEDLSVESFDTTAPAKAKGTVFGEQCTCYTNCTCPGCPTCEASCNGTCDASCNGTCDASCNGTCDASCNGGFSCLCPTNAADCTQYYDRTCNGNGTCGVYPCRRYAGDVY